MRFSLYSLRSRILGQLAILILAAMLLINVLMVKLWERDLLAGKARTASLVLHALGNLAAGLQRETPWKGSTTDPGTKIKIGRFLSSAGVSGAVIVDRRGEAAFSWGTPGKKDDGLLLAAQRASSLQAPRSRLSGKMWGLFWTVPERLTVSGPVVVAGRLLGGASLSCELKPLYLELARSQKLVLAYILLDTLILLLVGFALLSRTVVKPIRRLVALTHETRIDEPFIPPEELPRDEIGHLYRSLNLMRRRIDEQRRELQTHIARLEKANMELKETQEHVIRSEKLASVGRLAAGIAHEIGNPLAIVRGYIDLLKKENLTDEERRDALVRAESEITRAARIIRHLLDFSRPASTGPAKTDIHALIQETAALVEPQPAMKERRIGLYLQAEDPVVEADPGLLRQVFLNVLMNAADAVAQTTTPASSAEEDILVESATRGRHLVVRVEDRGPGLPPGEQDRVFDPFYTTKPPGKGTGLGLFVCHTIMEVHGGTIRVEPGRLGGTRVVLEIPRSAKAAGRGQGAGGTRGATQ